VDEPRPSPDKRTVSSIGPKRRIETQIHRRKKAKAVPPLEAEWDVDQGNAPSGLKMPSDKMKRQIGDGERDPTS
jgi:hypothetical protein